VTETVAAAKSGRGARIHGNREVKDGAAALIRGHPQSPFMRLDNRPADRQPHAQPCALVVNIGLNIRSTAPGSRPFPVSPADTITYPERCTSDLMESTRSPFIVAIESIALVIKFTSTCWSWTCSPLIRSIRSLEPTRTTTRCVCSLSRTTANASWMMASISSEVWVVSDIINTLWLTRQR
jgi:hypothetical protein